MPDVQSSFRPRVSGSGAFIDDFQSRTLIDEFLGGSAAVITSSTSNANVGELNWNVADSGPGGDVRHQTSTPEMLGWYQVEANAGGVMGVHLGPRPSISGGILLGSISYLQWRATFNGPIFPQPDGSGRIGLGSDSSASAFGARALWFEFSPGVSPFLLTGSSFDGPTTLRETTVRWAQGAVYDTRIVRVSETRIEYFIDSQLVGEHDTEHGSIVPPSDAVLSFMAQSEAGAANHQIGIDRFAFLRA